MNQHGSNEIIIYIKMPNRIFFFPQGQRTMCPLTGQMFDIYLPVCFITFIAIAPLHQTASSARRAARLNRLYVQVFGG